MLVFFISGFACGGIAKMMVPMAVSATPINPETRRLLLGFFSGIGAALIWGGFPGISRLGIQGHLNQYDITAIRYAVAGVILAPVLIRRGFQGLPAGVIAMLACGAGAPYLLLAIGGLAFAPAAHFGVVAPGTMLLISALGGWLWMNDRLTVSRMIGSAVILLGLLVMGWDGLHSPVVEGAWLGDCMFVAAGCAWAMFTLASRRWSVDPLHATALVAVLSFVFYLPVYFWFFKFDAILAAAPAEIGLQVGFQGILSAFVALFLYSRGVQILGAARGAVFAALVPGFATILAIPILAEWPTVLQATGVGLVTLGMIFALGLIRGRRAVSAST